jgi:endonuclease YncB( thermonuclease family)
VSPLPVLLPLLVLLALPGRAAPDQPTMPATVLGVESGDVLRVRLAQRPRRIRLACVDAPEPLQQPWAEEARQALERTLPVGTPVSVELRARDVYDRIVAVVRHRGEDVAAGQLRSGRVFVLEGYLGRCDDLPYRALEDEARGRGLGVWDVPGGLERPWDLRDRQDEPGEP